MRKFLIVLILIVALSLSFVLFQQGGRTADRVLSQEEALLSVTLSLPDVQYEMLVPAGSTVYDLMDEASSQYSFSFSGKNFPGMGFFVEEIKGVRQDSRKGLYWIYSINGKKAEVGISNYILKHHDVITWKYEKGY